MTSQDRARLTLAAHEAALAMHRDNGNAKATRAAQARVNGLRTKLAGIVNRDAALAEKLAWVRAA